LFKEDYVAGCDISFSSEISSTFETVSIVGVAQANWGQFGWGESPWGGSSRKKPTRTYVVPEKQRCSQLSIRFEHQIGYSRFQLNGLSVIFEPGSERLTR